jgi:hypothetical protein
MKKSLNLIFALAIVHFSFLSSEAAARYDITGAVYASSTAFTGSGLSDGDTLWVGSSSDTLYIDQNNSTYASTDLVIYIVDSGVVFWTDNWDWTLGANTVLVMGNGGDLDAPSPCNANKKFKLGTSNIASCSGGNADFSFRDIIDFGGYDPANPPVPVELMSFNHNLVSLSLAGSIVELNWATASELNNDKFEVYRSRDGVKFDLVQVVSGAGTSSSINTYSVIDEASFNDKSIYYKLVQIDYDGTSETFEILKVNLSLKNDQVAIFPNPAHDQVEFKFNNVNENNTVVTLTDMNGLVIYSETVTNSVKLDVSTLEPGLYFVRTTTNENEVAVKKLLIK